MKILLLLLSLTFIPVLNAQTYYDYEKVEVEELPTASAETIDKVYIKDNIYYITETEYISGQQRSVQLNDNLVSGKIYFKGMSKEQFENYSSSYSGGFNSLLYYNNGRTLCAVSKNGGKLQFQCNNNQIFIDYRTTYFPISSTYLNLNLSDISYPYLVVNEDYREIIDSFLAYEFDGYTTYSWKQVTRFDVIDVVLPTDDFYLFYSFDDISNFKILSNYNLVDLTDFQKLVLVLGFNSFFLIFIGFVIYIFIKLINKGITLLFR